MITGTYFDIQRYSIHNGAGIRTTVFLKGCPLSCAWCHNPEGRSRDVEVRLRAGRCIRCGACLEVCPQAPGNGRNPGVDPRRCTRCGRCVEACPAGAREMIGRQATVAEIIDAVERDRPFYEESGGGVTFSGGEPLLQGEFVLACLEAARDRGLHTAIDTSGYAARDVLERVAALADLFLYDLKILERARHEELTGAPLDPILENVRMLDGAGSAIWIRVPVIPGFTDDPESVEALGSFVASLERTRRVHLLPYHRMGSSKYERLGREDRCAGVTPPAQARIEEIAASLRRFGLDVRIGG